jgi:ankyrin repeat protein
LSALLAVALPYSITGRAQYGDADLADAAMRQDSGAIVALLESGADPNRMGPDGTPALHWPVRIGDGATAQTLLDAGADPNLANRIGLTPLSLAATNGDAPMMRRLLAAGADPDAFDGTGETPLMIAAAIGVAAAAEALLEHGAQVDRRDETYAQTALMFAARAARTELVTLLLTAGADPNARTRIGDTPEWILPNSRAGFGFGIGIVRGGLPADRGMRPAIPGGLTPLLYAARSGAVAAAGLLLEAGADLEEPDANGITPLLMAVSNNQVEAAHLLLAAGAAIDTPDWYGRTPLWSAVNVRNLYVSNSTFQNGIDRGPLLELIRALLEAGANPNARTAESPPVREHLLSVTGTLEWVDFTGQTPFIAAALAGDTSVMRLLLEHDADPHIATIHGTTALMAAAGINWVVSQTYTEGPAQLLEAVQLCHELGMDVNAVNSMGLTAVFGAANRGSDDIIRFLVEQGAKLDIEDKEGRTPLDWAKGVFLATHPAEPKPSSIALLESLLER